MTASLRPTMVQLPTDLVEKLDQRAARRQMSRSALIREALMEFLASDDEGHIAEAYREGYGRYPLDTTDEWGDLESFHDEVSEGRTTELHRW